MFFFLPTAHFLKQFYCLHTNGTFDFAPNHDANPSAKSKEPFFSQRSQLYSKFTIKK
jgi:hypothetical protein